MTIPALGPITELAARAIRRFPAGRQRLLGRLIRSPRFCAELPGSRGLRFEVEKTDLLPWSVFCTGEYEPRETALLLGMLREGGTFVDVGANWGYFTLLAAEKVGPSGRVVAIEADPRNYALVAGNIERNRLAQVTVIHAAAGSAAGTLEMIGYNDGQSNRGVSYVRGHAGPGQGRMIEGGGRAVEVRADTVDALLDGAAVDRVDLLKMDIEGAEALALPGMLDGLRSGRYRKIMIELHASVLGEYGADARKLMGILTGAGYRLWSVEPDRLEVVEPNGEMPARGELLAIAPGEPDPAPGT